MKRARKRELADWFNAAYSISTSARAGSPDYRAKGKPLNEFLAMQVREGSQVRVRFGFERFHVMFRLEGWQKRKRVLRLYRLEGLQLRRKKRRLKRASHARIAVREKAGHPDESWSMDFL